MKPYRIVKISDARYRVIMGGVEIGPFKSRWEAELWAGDEISRQEILKEKLLIETMGYGTQL